MKRIFALALTLTALAAPAQAHHVPQQPARQEATRQLIRTAERAGIVVFTDQSPSARGHCTAGLFGKANDRKQLLICVANHGNDVDELADTIRHELFHNAQYCKGGLIYPHLKEQSLAVARDRLHMPMGQYKPQQYYQEAEARAAAQLLSEEEIGTIVTHYCGRR